MAAVQAKLELKLIFNIKIDLVVVNELMLVVHLTSGHVIDGFVLLFKYKS